MTGLETIYSQLEAHGPQTMPQLVAATGLSKPAVKSYLRRLRGVAHDAPRERAIYISDWKVKPGVGAGWAGIYSVGVQPDAPKPKRHGGAKGTKSLDILLALEAHGELTIEEACIASGHRAPGVRAILYVLRGKSGYPRRLRITRWEKCDSRGAYRAVYALGSDPDAPKPRRMSASKELARKRERDLISYHKRKALMATREHVASGTRPSMWAQLMGGMK